MADPRSRSIRRWIVAGAILLALALAAQLALPRWLAGQIEASVSEALGRRVEVGRLRLSWLRGALTLEALEIGGPLDAEPLSPERASLRLERLGADLSWTGLLEGEIRLSEIALDAPSLRFERDAEGALVPLVLAEAAEEPAPEQDAGEEGGGWPVRVDALALRDLDVRLVPQDEAAQPLAVFTLQALRLESLAFAEGAVEVASVTFDTPGVRLDRALAVGGGAPSDVAARPPGEAPVEPAPPPPPAADPEAEDVLDAHHLESLEIHDADFTLLWEGGDPLDVSLDLSARNVSARHDAPFPIDLTLEVEGRPIVSTGELGLRPLRFDGDLRWEGLRLSRLLEASGADAGLELRSGTTDGELAIALLIGGDGEAPDQVRVSGRVGAAELDASLPDLSLAWSELSVAAESVTIPLEGEGAPEIVLSRVELLEPEIDYRRAAAAGAPVDTGSETQSAGAPAPRVSLAELEVEGGRVRVTDRTPARPFETRLSDLSLRGRGLRWPEQDAESLRLRARGARGARIAMHAALSGGRGRIETQVDRLALVPFDPYAQEYSGLRIRGGQTSVRSLVEIGATSARTDSSIDLHGLSVTEEEAGWFQSVFGMPLDVALALLRDMNGDIRVPVQAEFSQERTSLGLAQILGSTLRQALTGALTAPLKILGGVAGAAGGWVGGDGLAPLAGVPGEAELADEASGRLDELAATLERKPELKLVLRGRAGPDDDPGIARRRLMAQAVAGGPVDGDDRLGFFERRRVRSALARAAQDADAEIDAETRVLMEQLVTAARVEPAEREALARARAERARELLVGELGVAEAAVEVAEGEGGDPGVVIELGVRDAPTAEPAG